MKRSIKTLLGEVMFTSRLDSILLADVAVVVAFHRIDEAPDSDSLTVGREMFERYCRFFKRHFHVVPLRDLVYRLEHGDSIERHLAITFDDGYRDNFEHAAPVLAALSLPATFFIVSKWMGGHVVPWWDREQGMRYPWMTWDQVRTLHRSGFDIGAHTRTHVDLGVVAGEAAYDEIAGSRFDLEDQLGAPVDLFAYPYGRQRNLADRNLEIVKASGFCCCCSCEGGLTTAARRWGRAS